MPPRSKARKQPVMGQALINDRFGRKAKSTGGITRTNHETGEQYVTIDKKEASWMKMRSITEQGALDDFLATAELAGTDFTAEKMNSVQIIHTGQKNPFLLSSAQEKVVLGKHKTHRDRLTIPRRPKWDSSTSPEELDALERDSFLSWRRNLAELEEVDDLLMTPFERNLEVWRQLWRVIERSDLVVQIVDARNPLLFRSEDLERYVKDVDPKKENLLLVNKADMMTLSQRKAWAAYLREAGISYKFFSASLAQESNQAREAGESDDEGEEEASRDSRTGKGKGKEAVGEEDTDESDGYEEEEDEVSGEESEDEVASPMTPQTDLLDEDVRILEVHELEDLFIQHAPETTDDKKVQIGLVGYPNVGKSSTINALIGSKKVSVSATPGKTKHFQTIHLSPEVILCDCPGLVFPNFTTTKADLVCNGILPIDQMREYTGPCALVAQRIPQQFLEAIYGITIKTRPIEEGGNGEPTAEELLRAYAKARGFQTAGVGQPDESRASRFILKDYVNGKLTYVAPPPGDFDPREFNRELYDIHHLPEKRRAALAASMDAMALKDGASGAALSTDFILPPEQGSKGRELNQDFFKAKGSGHVSVPFHQRQLAGRKAKTLIALEKGLDPKDAALVSGKKHFKGNPKGGKKKHRIMHNKDD